MGKSQVETEQCRLNCTRLMPGDDNQILNPASQHRLCGMTDHGHAVNLDKQLVAFAHTAGHAGSKQHTRNVNAVRLASFDHLARQWPRGNFHQQPANGHIGNFIIAKRNACQHKMQHPVKTVQPQRAGASRHADQRHIADTRRHKQVARVCRQPNPVNRAARALYGCRHDITPVTDGRCTTDKNGLGAIILRLLYGCRHHSAVMRNNATVNKRTIQPV
ncbi:MAG: Uncharacterised protein [SAR116 cluster bacterium]|nr:MAG: Uncharacterised protein [SAR116 cluster bacterium]